MKTRMKTKCAALVTLATILTAVTLPYTPAYGAEQNKDSAVEVIVQPKYTAMYTCTNQLTLQSMGRLFCAADTHTPSDHIAGVTIELQQYNSGSWTTIKTWSGEKVNRVSLEQYWYVVRGTYRLKLTHTSTNRQGVVVDNITKYSTTVVYN